MKARVAIDNDTGLMLKVKNACDLDEVLQGAPYKLVGEWYAANMTGIIEINIDVTPEIESLLEDHDDILEYLPFG